MPKDKTDPENEDTTTDEGELEETQDSATDDKSQQSDVDTGSDQDIDWEERYKGLQRATEKKRLQLEGDLEKANQNLAATTQMLEEAKGDGSVLDKQRKDAEDAKAKLDDEVAKLQREHDELQKQVNQQDIVMREFPQLAPVAKYIPVADDDDDFRKGAEDFSKAIESMVGKSVEKKLDGSSPTFEEGADEELESSDELDQAWADVYQFAGVKGKEKEYQDAFAKIQSAGQTPDL